MVYCCLGWKFIINFFLLKCFLNMVKREKKMVKLGVVVFLLLLWLFFIEMEIVLGEFLGGFFFLRKIFLLEEKVNYYLVMKMIL